MNEEKVKVECQGEEEPVTIGCPSLGIPRIPSGADGVEPLKRTDYEQIIADVFHKCNEAFIHAPQQRDARPGYFKVVVGDLADALASVVPCERAAGTSAPTDANRTKVGGDVLGAPVYRTPQHIVDFIFETCNVPFADQADPALLKKIAEKFHLSPNKSAADYWKVAEGVQLERYKGTNVTRLIAVRKGKESNPDVIFEIFINATTKKATIKRDDTVLFTIGVDGLSARRVQTVAISALRSYLRENARQHRHGKERIHRRVAERQADRMNAEPTSEDLENA